MIYYMIMAFGVIIAAFSQMLLKKASQKQYSSFIRQYLNVYVITAYSLFVVSTLCTAIAMRQIPLSMQPVWNSLGMVLVAFFSCFFFKEKLSSNKVKGVLLIVVGIIIFAI